MEGEKSLYSGKEKNYETYHRNIIEMCYQSKDRIDEACVKEERK